MKHPYTSESAECCVLQETTTVPHSRTDQHATSPTVDGCEILHQLGFLLGTFSITVNHGITLSDFAIFCPSTGAGFLTHSMFWCSITCPFFEGVFPCILIRSFHNWQVKPRCRCGKPIGLPSEHHPQMVEVSTSFCLFTHVLVSRSSTPWASSSWDPPKPSDQKLLRCPVVRNRGKLGTT